MVWASTAPGRIITTVEQSVSSIITATHTPCLPMLQGTGKCETAIGPGDRGEQQRGPDLAGDWAGSHFRRVAMQCNAINAGRQTRNKAREEGRDTTKRKGNEKEWDTNRKRKAKNETGMGQNGREKVVWRRLHLQRKSINKHACSSK